MTQKIEALASIELAQGWPGTCKTGFEIIPNGTAKSKCEIYEANKKYLQRAGLTHGEYEIEVLKLAEKLGV